MASNLRSWLLSLVNRWPKKKKKESKSHSLSTEPFGQLAGKVVIRRKAGLGFAFVTLAVESENGNFSFLFLIDHFLIFAL